jgi:hypothetical protein
MVCSLLPHIRCHPVGNIQPVYEAAAARPVDETERSFHVPMVRTKAE